MKKFILGLVLGTIGFAPNAFAQVELEEIVVTAQRREESLQDVPVSITAFSATQIENRNLTEAKDFLAMTPNVNFTEDGEVGQRAVGISMRGVSDFANTFTGVGGLSNSFGIYLDEFNIANNATKTANPQLQDMARLEILRGPQGTYFGRNATGGALNITTKLPQDKIEYELGAGFSRFNTWEVSSMVNIPITDDFFVRAVGWYEESDGFITNLSPRGNDDSYRHYNVRAAFRWVPTDRFSADFSAMRTVENDGTDSNINTGVLDLDTPNTIPFVLQTTPADASDATAIFVPTGQVLPVDSGAGFFPNNRRTINKDFPEFNTGRMTILNLRLNYAGDGWSVRSVTGYLDSRTDRAFDQDLSQYSSYETFTGRKGETFSQELRFRLERENWDLTVGGLYAKDDADNYGVIGIGDAGFNIGTILNPDGTLLACVGFCLGPRDVISRPQIDTFDAESFAVFAEANWQATERLKLTVGVRYTDDDIEINEATINAGRSVVPFDEQPLQQLRNFDQPASNDPNNFAFNRGVASSDAFTPRVVVTYAPNDDLTTYASVSRGYKPAGLTLVDTPAGDVEVPFEKEKLWNYELGVKWRGFDNRAEINFAAFYMDWSGLQIPSVNVEIVDGNVVNNFRITNTDAKSLGIELEAQALVTDNFVVGGGVGLLDAEFTSFGADDPFVIQGMGFDIDGTTLPRAPKTTVNLFGQYDFQVGGLASWIRAEWSYRSKTTSDIEAAVSQLAPENTPLSQSLGLGTNIVGSGGIVLNFPRQEFPMLVPAYDVVNLRAGVSGQRWSIVGYIENLLDKNYYTGTQENFGFGGFRARPHFRVAGVNVKFSYD